MPPDSPRGHALLHFAKYSDQVHTGTLLCKILDLPLVCVCVFHQTIGLASLDYYLPSVHVCYKYNTTKHQTFESTCVNELFAPASV